MTHLYVETTYGLPSDATERERRAYYASKQRARLRTEAKRKEREQKNLEVKRCDATTHDTLCQGGLEGAYHSGTMLELELTD